MSKKIAISLNLNLNLTRYAMLYQGIQRYAEENTGWSIYWDHLPECKLKKCQTGAQAEYDGVIGRITENTYLETERLNIPCVNLWYNSKLQSEIPSCLADAYEAGRVAAEHLLSRGFKEITIIDYRDNSSLHFIDGVKSVLGLLGYSTKIHYLTRGAGKSEAEVWEQRARNFEKWSEGWTFPMAIASSSVLLIIPTFLKSRDLRIPEDVALLFKGDDKGICDSIKPYITTIDTNYIKIGYEAARMLHQTLESKELEKTHVYIEPKGIVARHSTDTYATDDELVSDALRYIADNISTRIQVPDVVAQVPISRCILEKRFKASTGKTIKEEINRLRVICAQRLLLDKNVQIKDVYIQSGFSSAKHMRGVWKTTMGMTPGEYRQTLLD
jgi:LacI family transcriptional regulator